MPTKPKRIKRPWVPDGNPGGIVNRDRDVFYHTNAWKMAAKGFISLNPLCVECKKAGYLVPSVVTDHIIPKDICQDPYDAQNWQALCKKCHAKKSAKDKKHFK